MGEINVPLSAGWIRDQLANGKLPPIGLQREDAGLRWSVFQKDGKEQQPNKIKSIVNSGTTLIRVRRAGSKKLRAVMWRTKSREGLNLANF